MGKYKVMLVDDEEEVREAIEKRIDWDAIGFQVTSSAENGEDALEKAGECLPDVVMSDIHMPFMDGLTFCRHLKEQLPGVKIVIFSGYDEFEYAKEAIKLEVEEYILKPIDAEELKQVFIRIHERLDDEHDRNNNIEKLTKYYEESLPILKEQMLTGLLEGRFSDEDIARYERDYDFSMEAAFYSVAVIRPTDKRDNEFGTEELSSGLIQVSIKQLAEEQLNRAFSFRSINYLGTITVIVMLNNTPAHKDFINVMDRICRMSKKAIGISVTAGVGKLYGNLRDISHSFSEAKDAASYQILLDSEQAIYIQDVEPKSDDEYFMDENQIQQLVREIKIGSNESLENSVKAMVMRMKNSMITLPQLQLFFTEIFVEILRLARNYQLSPEQMKEFDIDIYNEIRKYSSLEAFGNGLLEMCIHLKNSIRRERTDSAKLITENAKRFISEHYSDVSLTVDRVCGELNVSPAYFSALFKKETGMSFVTYLTKIRMEQALNLLNSTDEKSYIIAGMVGYDEPNYFSYVFKKYYGVSPSKYRQQG